MGVKTFSHVPKCVKANRNLKDENNSQYLLLKIKKEHERSTYLQLLNNNNN